MRRLRIISLWLRSPHHAVLRRALPSIKKPAVLTTGFLLLVALDVEQTKDMLADDHENEVDQPDNPAAEEDADDSRNNLAILKTRNNAANPRSDGDYRQDNAYNVGKTKVIAFCHGSNSFKIFVVSLYYVYATMSSIY